MRAILTFLGVLFSSSAFCQDMMGKWSGLAPQNINGVFYIELNITKVQGNVYTGIASSTAISGPFKGKMQVKAMIERQADGTILYREENIIDSTKATNYYWCPKQAQLKFSSTTDSMEMSGPWASPTASCPPGTMKLKKAIRQPLPDPPILAKSSPTLTSPVVAPVIEPVRIAGTNVRIRGTRLKVEVWDFDAIDEDSVSLKLNGKQVGPKDILLPAYKKYGSPDFTYPMELIKGDNTLEIYAKNEGLKPNNTVGLIITDDESSQRFFFTLKAKERSVIHFLRM